MLPTKVADEDAENCSNEVVSSCAYNKYKKNNKSNEIIPNWMKHPELCVSIPLNEEEQKEMDELMSIINERRDIYDWRI